MIRNTPDSVAVNENKHAGGRPPELSRQLAEARRLASAIQPFLRAGLQKLADAYPDLMDVAIAKAKGGDVRMLQMCLELLPKLVSVREEDDTPWGELQKKWRGDLHLHQHIEQPVVEGTLVNERAAPSN